MSGGVHGSPYGPERREVESTGVHGNPWESTGNGSQLGSHDRRKTAPQARLPATRQLFRSAIGAHIGRKLIGGRAFIELDRAIDRDEDPGRLIDPPSLAPGHLDDLANFDEIANRRMRSWPGHSEKLIGAGGGDDPRDPG